MTRSALYSFLTVVVLAVGGFIYTLSVGNEPLLGLDLQGGVSVVLQPTEEASDEALDQALEIIRNRVDGLGVAEPEISRQGQTIVVDLPGVGEQQRALELVGQTAELQFRPVLLDPNTMALLAGSGGDLLNPTTDPVEGTDTGTDTTDTDTTDTDTTESDSTEETDSTDTTLAEDPADTEEESLGPIRRRQTTSTTEADEPESTDTTESDSTTTTDDTATDDTATDDTVEDPEAVPELDEFTQFLFETCSQGVSTPEDDAAEEYVVLESQTGGLYCLGPVFVGANGTPLTGRALETASVGLDNFSGWTVNPVFNSGEDGIDLFNEAAAICANPVGPNAEVCPPIGSDTSGNPRGALAIVLDHEVISAPTINSANFDRENITISGSFDEDSANDLSVALRYGALPLELETQQTRTVSATIGDDVLQSGIIAGIVGLLVVAIYLLAYYRLAGLVAVGGIALSGLMLWSIIGYLGDRYGLAISVAGIVGLIVSIGVSADSNIVYFENVKDIAAKGRRIGTSVERAYSSAISTIIKADVVSLIAAGLLYFLTVGAVKGFALYLGVATFLDLIVSLMFMRPALTWLATREAVRQNPRLLGVPEGSK